MLFGRQIKGASRKKAGIREIKAVVAILVTAGMFLTVGAYAVPMPDVTTKR